jgi:hypothetical protein
VPKSDSSSLLHLSTEISHWVPALGFSAGLDTLTTGMIAGRLICHHRRQKKLGGAHTIPYLPLVTIFIESAALSLISKVIQISIPSVAIELNPVVVPLCVSGRLTSTKSVDISDQFLTISQTISSNLIILRKALGLSAFGNPVKDTPHLPTIQFKSQHESQPPLGTYWGGLETLVVRGVGGNPEVGENAMDTSNSNPGAHSEQS